MPGVVQSLVFGEDGDSSHFYNKNSATDIFEPDNPLVKVFILISWSHRNKKTVIFLGI